MMRSPSSRPMFGEYAERRATVSRLTRGRDQETEVETSLEALG